MVALLLAASEPSKVPWYIAGGLLALWAVVLSWIGLTHPQFPSDIRGQRLVIGISAVLAAFAVAMAVISG
jgi:hypothetical protein